MPPSTIQICKCSECIEKGGLNSAGKPRGVSWEKAKYKPHILRVKREAELKQDQQLSQASGKMFVSTIVDEEPSFDASSGSPPLVEALVAGIQRMRVSDTPSDLPSEDSGTSQVDELRRMHPSPRLPEPLAAGQASRKHKRVHVNATRSEKILRVALDQLQSCADHLCRPCKGDDLRHVEDTIRQVQQAVDSLAKKPASRSDVVDVLSHEVQQKLDRIHNHLMELRNISDLNEPLYYETSKRLSFPGL